jgi:hypothetical protein
MKKHLTTGRIGLYLLYLTAVGTLVLGTVYARYRSDVTGTGTAEVAAAAMDVTGTGSSSLDLTKVLSGMKPGTSKEVEFVVTNAKDGAVSEVAEEYQITVSTTGNLPLTYVLSAKSTGTKGTFAEVGVNPAPGRFQWTGGFLPDSAETVHTYQLTVTWPGEQKAGSYTDEIDLVTLTVDAVQAKPVESTP